MRPYIISRMMASLDSRIDCAISAALFTPLRQRNAPGRPRDARRVSPLTLLWRGCLYKICTLALAASPLITHAQCMRVHYGDGWTEQIDVATVDSITFDDNKQHQSPTIMLNNGLRMSAFGIGTYSLHNETCFNSVYTALKNGYRLIDTAYMYGNEEEVGRAVRQAIADGVCKREDVTVITKIYPGSQFANPEQAIQDRIDKLNIGYVDIMLLHHPGDNDVKAYKAMEKQVEAGKIHSLGISCFYIDELKRFLPQVSIKPVLVQNEIHPYYQDTEVVDFIHSQGIVVQAWYPLGGRGYQAELLNDPVLKRIAAAHNKSLVQVILRWHYQRRVVAIPGSSNPAHIAENIDIFDFALTDQEMADIAALNRDEKHDWY